MLRYGKKSLFDITGKAILVHAVNCKGVMGSGIAKEFKKRFPEAFDLYHADCVRTGQQVGLAPSRGHSKVYATADPNVKMGCLFTSQDYGLNVDPPETILISTALAVREFLRFRDAEYQIYSNKFNSGFFNVPWVETEAIIQTELVKYPDLVWTVCDPSPMV